MTLKHSYSLLAPFYDMAVRRPLNSAGQESIERLQDIEGKHILINGIGTGLDLEYLPQGEHYTGSDITPSMLRSPCRRARKYSLAPLRRSLNTVLRHIAARTDLAFEEVLSYCTNLHVVSDDPALAGGWFRQIELVKIHTDVRNGGPHGDLCHW